MPIYIIEHLEDKVWPWCLIEYKHISQMVGKSHVWFTHTRSAALKKYGSVFSESVAEQFAKGKLKNACVLDPVAPKTLTPGDAQQFNYFIFGGILGDDPPQQRTSPELTSKMHGIAVRNIGKKQMSTDTAVYVVQQIVSGKKLSELQFQDGVEISLGKNESTLLPYRYVVKDGKPMISDELAAYLKKRGF